MVYFARQEFKFPLALMVNVRQISFNNEIYVTVWVTPRSFKNLDDFYRVFIRMRMKESSTLSSQSTSDCHKKRLKVKQKIWKYFSKKKSSFCDLWLCP